MTSKSEHKSRSFALATWAVSRAPDRVLHYAARIGGRCHYWLAGDKRRSYLHNTQAAIRFGRDRLPWRSFQNHALNVLELLKAVSETDAAIMDRVDLYGAHHIDAALGGNKGLILVTFHFGNWELSGLVLSLKGYPITTIAGEQLNAGWSEDVKSFKQRFGIKVLSPDRSLRDLYRDLADNRVVVLHIDGDLFTTGVQVPFLGRSIHVPDGPARLSRATGAPIGLAFCQRGDKQRLGVYIEQPKPPPVHREDENSLTSALVGRIEKCIMEDPGQWCIFRTM